jgi:aminopeptidase N
VRVLTAAVVVLAAATACTPSAGGGTSPPPGPTATSRAGPPPAGPVAAADPEAGLSRPVADPLYPAYGNPALDVLHYNLSLAWSPTDERLTATATLTIRAMAAVGEITLDFSRAYTIDGVSVGGTRVTPRRRGDDLIVAARLARDQRATLVVRYHGTPRTVPMPSGRGDFPEGLGLRAADGGEAWTMQEPYGAFTWYPVNDHPSDEAVYDVAVRVPKGWAGVAHGRLVSVTSDAAGDTFHWRSTDPVASYLATLAVARYTKLTDTGPRGVPITYWLRTGKDERFEPALRRTPELLDWLERHFGPYPFPTAGVVLVDSLSAMETQQMVTYGVRLGGRQGQPSLALVEEILLHEFAHQWFGDAVTPTTWRGLWLNEGFAYYAEWLWAVRTRGDSDAQWLEHAREGDRESRPVAGPPGNPDPAHFGEHNVYHGPSLMLREIHLAVGDTAFFALARDWVQTQRNRPVDRAGFIAFVNRHTGRDFTALINRWLDARTTPAVP